MTVASVAPVVLRTCICIWSYVSVSGQCGWYQKLRLELPDGTVTVCESVLSPLTALVEPTSAACEPEWAVLTVTGRKAPLALHGATLPVSKPGFCTTFAVGVYVLTATSS